MHAAVTAAAAVTASPAAALETGADSVMGSGSRKPETPWWTWGDEGEEDVGPAQPLESVAPEAAPAALAAVPEGGSENGRFGLGIERKCCELASAEQDLAVHADVYAAEPAAV